MKFGPIIFALCALPASNAFLVQQPRTFSATLQAKNYDYLSGGSSAAASSDDAAEESAPTIEDPYPLTKLDGPKTTQEIFSELTPVKVQGGTLKTCSFNEEVERVSVYLKTEGRPLNANVELWQGPDNSPQKMTVYLEDGSLRPFRCEIESPGASNSVSIRNTGEMEFPLLAGLDVEVDKNSIGGGATLNSQSEGRIVQGGAVYTTPFGTDVKSVQILLKTDGRPMNARIELLQGPNNTKQVMEVYTEDGSTRPFFVVIDTPGTGNVVRIVNTATIEYPLTATIESYITDNSIVEESGSSTPGGLVWS